MTTKYKDTLDKLIETLEYNHVSDVTDESFGMFVRYNYEVIRRALLIADKLMQEPSEAMTQAAIESYNQNGKFALVTHFKAMRDQLLKEVEND